MGEIRQGETGIGRRKLFVRDHGGNGVQAGAAKALVHGDPEETQLPELSKELDVEPLFVIKDLGLRVDLSFGK